MLPDDERNSLTTRRDLSWIRLCHMSIAYVRDHRTVIWTIMGIKGMFRYTSISTVFEKKGAMLDGVE